MKVQPNIKVCCRSKPDMRQSFANTLYSVEYLDTFTNTVSIRKDKYETLKYQFDLVLTSEINNSDLYSELGKELVKNLLKGHTSTLFAYGQTGSGKSHSIIGPSMSGDERGLLPRAIVDLFNKVLKDRDHLYKISISYYQVYMDTVYDLIGNNLLQIREDAKDKVHLIGLTEIDVKCPEQAINTIYKANSRRTRGMSSVQSNSDRSHTICALTLEKRASKIEGMETFKNFRKTSRLYVCDLAGHDRNRRVDNKSPQKAEYKSIHNSLISLGSCLRILARGNAKPAYRESKLTHVLKPALESSRDIAILLAFSADPSHLDATLSTLQFGLSCAFMKNTMKRVEPGTDQVAEELYRELQDRATQLYEVQKELGTYKEENKVLVQNIDNLNSSLNAKNAEIEDINNKYQELKNQFEEFKVEFV